MTEPSEMHEAMCPALTGGRCTCERNDPAVDKAWARFCGRIGDGPDAPYPGMISAFERYYSQSFTDKDWRNEASVWAAAWKQALLTAAAPTTQPAPAHADASYESMNLAVMVLSDCGHSSNYKPLLERVAGRIDRHVERLLTAQQADIAMRAQAAPQPSPAAQGDALDAGRWRRLVNASELSFPVATIADDPENGAVMLYGRKALEDFVDRMDEIPNTYDAARAAQEGKSHDN